MGGWSSVLHAIADASRQADGETARRTGIALERSFSLVAAIAVGRVLGDPFVATGMIDCIVHDARVISLKGESNQLKEDRNLGRAAADITE